MITLLQVLSDENVHEASASHVLMKNHEVIYIPNIVANQTFLKVWFTTIKAGMTPEVSGTRC